VTSEKVSRRVVKVCYEFACLGCGIGFKITLASLRGVSEPMFCPVCAEPDLQKVHERVVCSMPIVARRGGVKIGES